jgi:hypothetical protein
MGGRAQGRLCSLNFLLTKPRLVGIPDGKPVPLGEGTPRMTGMEESRLRPSWWRMGTPQKQKVINQAQFRKKDVIFGERSRYVYENKQKYANLSDRKGDISA